jgi:hypothetical protein
VDDKEQQQQQWQPLEQTLVDQALTVTSWRPSRIGSNSDNISNDATAGAEDDEEKY